MPNNQSNIVKGQKTSESGIWKIRFILYYLFMYVVVRILFETLMYVYFCSYIPIDKINDEGLWFVVWYLKANISLFLPLLFLLFFKSKSNWQSIALSKSNLKRNITLGLIFGVLIIPLVIFLDNLFIPLSQQILGDEIIDINSLVNPREFYIIGNPEVFLSYRIILIILICLIGPIVEEITFRGYFYKLLKSKYNRILSVCLCSLLFAYFHFTPGIFIGLFGFSIFLFVLLEYTKSLIPCIIAHSIYNFSILQLYLYLHS